MKTKSQFLKGCAQTLVLKVLSERPMYGYEIAQTLTQRSDNIIDLGQGTLYPLLYSLEKKGLIKISKQGKPQVQGRKRLYYEPTAKGKLALEEDTETWFSIERGMNLILRGACE